jgi:outer membrane receptor for ferrienterochelin and colicins
MKKIILILILSYILVPLNAQVLKGKVTELGDDKQLVPVVGASLQWLGTDIGTFTNESGIYEILSTTKTNQLIVSYVSYESDTIIVNKEQKELNIILSGAKSLGEVQVLGNQGSYISIKPILTQVITSEGLRRAACCNLSESFEGSLSVDVEYSDAVSGAKQITMLGLAGIYTQILLENVPYNRLLANQFGLGFVPGPWMEAISVAKGTSSVSNGYEGITGQINIDYKKPETNMERVYMNLYGSSMGKVELNFNSRFDMSRNKPISGMFLLHTESQLARVDMNHDGFMDIPLNKQLNAMYRIDYRKSNWLEGRTMISYVLEDRTGGEMDYNAKTDRLSNSVYGLNIKTNKVDIISKNGILFKGHEFKSLGTIVSLTYQNNKSVFGLRNYDAQQMSGYMNILFNDKYGSKHNHKVGFGISAQIDYLDEYLGPLLSTELPYSLKKTEIVPGAYVEYAYSIDEKFIIMPGMRLDYNDYYNQLFWTPRIHTKWQITPTTSFRASAGKAYRVSNVIVENLSLLVSNRTFDFKEDLKPEEAYNMGGSIVKTFKTKGGKSSFTVDYYYTHFVNQIIVDMDKDPHIIYIYNLNGDYNGMNNRSYSNAFQAELILYPIKRFEVTLAYRYNDVKVTTDGHLQQKVLMSPHKALVNLNYALPYDKWKFNISLQYNGKMRLPIADVAGTEVPEYRISGVSPAYYIMNAQITKKLRKWEFYVGGENLLNYKQEHPILGHTDPFGSKFDASMVYAPIVGIMGYAGIRLTIK